MPFLRRLWPILAAFALACGHPAAASEPHRIVAVGDLHGDFNAYLAIVEAAGVADDTGHWKGGDSMLLQLGDVPDRGPGTLEIIQHLQKLEKSAAKAGGKVIELVGNHEAMNMTGDLRYTTPAEFAAFRNAQSEDLRRRVFERNEVAIISAYRRQDPQITRDEARDRWFAEYPLGKLEHRQAWSPTGPIGRWVLGHAAIVKIGETLFVHGGISVETAARPIDAVNADVHAALSKGESGGDSILTAPLGPLWYRGNVERDPAGGDGTAPGAGRPSIDDELTQILAAYGAKRLVVAHTPDRKGIEATSEGRLIRIDTGISAYYGGPRSYLEIVDGKAIAWHEDNQGKWISEALPSPQ